MGKLSRQRRWPKPFTSESKRTNANNSWQASVSPIYSCQAHLKLGRITVVLARVVRLHASVRKIVRCRLVKLRNDLRQHGERRQIAKRSLMPTAKGSIWNSPANRVSIST